MPRPRDWLLVPLMVVIAAIGLIWGGRNTWRTVRNWSPLAISCADYVRERPSAEWVRLEKCVPDFAHYGVEHATTTRDDRRGISTTQLTAVLVPLMPAGMDPSERSPLVLSIEHGTVLVALGADHPTDADFRTAADALDGPLEGLVEGKLDRSATSRDEVKNLHLGLTPDFTIITYGARPRPLWLSLGVLLVGAGATYWLRRKWRRRRRDVELAKATIVSG